ncbi:hypothetical protein VF04_03995 [Nostoc linckia z7]|uniref:Uncharacterized protein n=2 Tax=Nostoc linckia TaxID=92942 RepID=A0A9Q5ZG01_NOSLI|nr:hypothetical protein [Nostoc linckia]PHK42879.1 hypothetical protein VF12_00695 [Nostoc linckia z15]PHK48036.1 hypothetical protein VF13_01670 [Nostoc linckia z16]PHJ64956.1 hypothetical protein VF02_11480 [Nostoc linckia z1]PHJ70134.1 hypothetical protein VF05_11640 [Nostoc linckia z3]PHJ75035.1 hypothetical protein VF03_11800 [Nostoc linckia z2]
MTTITFGKHKGSDISKIPTEYLEWGADKLDSPKWRQAFESELERRNSEKNKRDSYIKANIDSPEVWELLVKEAEQELETEENFAIENDVQYDGRVISQSEIEKLAKEKLAEYQKQVAVENLQKEFEGREGLTPLLLKKIEDIHYEWGLERSQFSTDAKYEVACEYMRKLEEIRGY